MIFNLFSDKKYLINGEQLEADDFDQDSTVIEGAEQADEMVLPAEDYGIFFFFLKKKGSFRNSFVYLRYFHTNLVFCTTCLM